MKSWPSLLLFGHFSFKHSIGLSKDFILIFSVNLPVHSMEFIYFSGGTALPSWVASPSDIEFLYYALAKHLFVTVRSIVPSVPVRVGWFTAIHWFVGALSLPLCPLLLHHSASRLYASSQTMWPVCPSVVSLSARLVSPTSACHQEQPHNMIPDRAASKKDHAITMLPRCRPGATPSLAFDLTVYSDERRHEEGEEPEKPAHAVSLSQAEGNCSPSADASITFLASSFLPPTLQLESTQQSSLQFEVYPEYGIGSVQNQSINSQRQKSQVWCRHQESQRNEPRLNQRCTCTYLRGSAVNGLPACRHTCTLIWSSLLLSTLYVVFSLLNADYRCLSHGRNSSLSCSLFSSIARFSRHSILLSLPFTSSTLLLIFLAAVSFRISRNCNSLIKIFASIVFKPSKSKSQLDWTRSFKSKSKKSRTEYSGYVASSSSTVLFLFVSLMVIYAIRPVASQMAISRPANGKSKYKLQTPSSDIPLATNDLPSARMLFTVLSVVWFLS